MPPVLSTTIVTRIEATTEGGGEVLPLLVSLLRVRGSTDDSDEADDDGDGLPLRS
ncbi:UNVERIFIED_CONTAM: hypothetical protein Sangu_1454900 [Sesamum angustifolium]|uniref:Uncharacterized protein n=1 Tax=Sesamum angustifolium TaxID=2727405 RepID=A0AAW2N897_9LAMI